MVDCVFCKIIRKQIPSVLIEENEDLIVIKDIAPKAPIHYLIIPKKHVVNISAVQKDDHRMLSSMLFMAQHLGMQLSIPNAFTLVVNNGKEAGQEVFHLHVHFLSSSK